MDKKKKFFDLIIFVSIVFFIQSVLINQTCYAAGISKKAKETGTFEKILEVTPEDTTDNAIMIGSKIYTYMQVSPNNYIEPMIKFNDKNVLISNYSDDKYLIYDAKTNRLKFYNNDRLTSNMNSRISLKEDEIAVLRNYKKLYKFNFKTREFTQFELDDTIKASSAAKIDDRYFLLFAEGGKFCLCDSEKMLCEIKGKTFFPKTNYKQLALQTFKLNDNEILIRYDNHAMAEIYDIEINKMKLVAPFKETTDENARIYTYYHTPAFQRTIYKLKDNVIFSVEEADKSKISLLKEKIFNETPPPRFNKFRNKIVIREYKDGGFKVIDEFLLDKRIKGNPENIVSIALSENEFLIFNSEMSNYCTNIIYYPIIFLMSLYSEEPDVCKKVFYVNTKTKETVRLKNLPIPSLKTTYLKIDDDKWLISLVGYEGNALILFTRNKKE